MPNYSSSAIVFPEVNSSFQTAIQLFSSSIRVNGAATIEHRGMTDWLPAFRRRRFSLRMYIQGTNARAVDPNSESQRDVTNVEGSPLSAKRLKTPRVWQSWRKCRRLTTLVFPRIPEYVEVFSLGVSLTRSLKSESYEPKPPQLRSQRLSTPRNSSN